MTADLGIVGGGFWGIAAASMASERGLDVTVWDDGTDIAASPNAAGIVQLWWYDSVTTASMLPDWWDPAYPEYGVEWLEDHVTLLDTGELYSSYQGADGRFRDDCYLVEDCSEFLDLHATTEARVQAVEPGTPWNVTFEDRDPATCDRLLVTAGAWTDDLLEASDLDPVGVEPLRGRALLLEPHDYDEAPPPEYDADKDALPDSMPDTTPHTVLPRPYTHFTLRPYRGRWRIGDTTEQDISGDEARLQELMKQAGTLVGEYDVAEIQDGLRPVCDTITVEHLSREDEPLRTGAVATGGHRVGLLLAPICARRALRLLDLW